MDTYYILHINDTAHYVSIQHAECLAAALINARLSHNIIDMQLVHINDDRLALLIDSDLLEN